MNIFYQSIFFSFFRIKVLVIILVFLAKENLFHEKFKIVLSVSGVVLSVFLILSLSGVYYSMDVMMDKIVGETNADLWVTSKGAAGSIHSPSLLSIDLYNDLNNVEGVQSVSPLIRMPFTTNIEGKKVLLYINGYDVKSGLGGPWKVIKGSSALKNGEVIIDRVLAAKNGIKIGDNITIVHKDFTVTGISDETNMMIAYMVFMTFEDAKSFTLEDITNFFLVKIDPSYDIPTVKENIESNVPSVSVRTSKETAQAYKDEIIGAFLPILLILTLIGFLVGTLVIGLLLYTLTIEKTREYGIIKAIGGTNIFLYKIALFQALIISLFGFSIAVLLFNPILYIIQRFMPEFVAEINPQLIMMAFLSNIIAGVVAASIPMRRLSKIDPAIAFKEW